MQTLSETYAIADVWGRPLRVNSMVVVPSGRIGKVIEIRADTKGAILLLRVTNATTSQVPDIMELRPRLTVKLGHTPKGVMSAVQSLSPIDPQEFTI
jgi:hypothetical protein